MALGTQLSNSVYKESLCGRYYSEYRFNFSPSAQFLFLFLSLSLFETLIIDLISS
jgi:hypothetical protein